MVHGYRHNTINGYGHNTINGYGHNTINGKHNQVKTADDKQTSVRTSHLFNADNI